ncbi:hypothetical protein SEUCBS140593_004231 [Sporothrix eucalyptigena]|uniref:SWIM-type domain-containing protein n=1 Tax=Sporothrix eucalyptigena TaxID=1812306 RepID=A0ABP0BLV3_9PEZI
MHPPTGKFSKLSLSKLGMPPVTRSHGHGGGHSTAGGASSSAPGPALSTSRNPHYHTDDERIKRRSRNDNDEDGSLSEEENDDDEDDEDEDEDEDEDDGPVRSPLTDLFYNVENLDDETQELVRELFRAPAAEETPPMVIEWCGISNDPDVFAFQLQEVVPRTIRIGSPTSRIPRPSCNCTGNANTPCRHLVWLMDQIAKQTLHDHPPDVPLVLDGATGFPREIGSDAYARIADFHIDILANTLHCGAGPPSGRPNLHRVRESREILAGLYGVQDDDAVDAYAPEIFDQDNVALESLLWSTAGDGGSDEDSDEEGSEDGGDRMDEDNNEASRSDKGKGVKETASGKAKSGSQSSSSDVGDEGGARIQRTTEKSAGRAAGQQTVRDLVERGDLQRTVLRMLVSNDEFFAMFLKLLKPSDKARDPFRKIQQRVEAVLDALLAVRPKSQQQQQQQRRQSQLLMPPPDPRTRRVAPAVAGSAAATPPLTPIITVTAAAPPSLEEDSGSDVTVAWAARHVQNAVSQIHLLLQRQLPHPPGEWARRSAGRALVWILHALVFFHNRDAHGGATQDDRNLYQRLVGNSDGKGQGGQGQGFFVLDVLEPLHEQVQLRSQLKRIRRRIQVNGYREPYMRRLDDILEKMNTAAASKESGASTMLAPPPTAGSKRQGSNTNTPTDRRPKRMR